MRWGLIGASNIAQTWMAPAMRSVGDEVVAVVSGDARRAAEFAADLGIPRSTDRVEALGTEDIDAVYISSTNEKHEAQVLEAAERGWHVLCEKPLATSLPAAQRMVEACERAGVLLAVNHHLRHNSAHAHMRQCVLRGRLGQLVAARVNQAVFLRQELHGWRLTDPAAGGGVVLDIAVHHADSLGYLLGEYPVEVQAMVSSSGLAQGMEDNALSLWRFPSGLVATTHQAFTLPYAPVGIELHGTAGSLVGHGVLRPQDEGTLVLREASGETAIALDGASPYVRCLQSFHDAVQGRPSVMADGRAGLKSLAVALAILQSAREGRAVTVQYEFN